MSAREPSAATEPRVLDILQTISRAVDEAPESTLSATHDLRRALETVDAKD